MFCCMKFIRLVRFFFGVLSCLNLCHWPSVDRYKGVYLPTFIFLMCLLADCLWCVSHYMVVSGDQLW